MEQRLATFETQRAAAIDPFVNFQTTGGGSLEQKVAELTMKVKHLESRGSFKPVKVGSVMFVLKTMCAHSSWGRWMVITMWESCATW